MVGITAGADGRVHSHTSAANRRGKLTNRTMWLLYLIATSVVMPTSALNVHWCPRQCDCYHQYSVVDCSARGLATVPPLSNLTERLYLEDNMLDELPDDALDNVPRLNVLTLHNNHLHHLTTAALCALPVLDELTLNGNGLREIEVDPDCTAPHLHQLEVHDNKLLRLPANLSVFAPALLTLNASYNQLGSAQLDDSYAQFQQLHTLDLRANNIHFLHSADLQPVASTLHVLHLVDCGLLDVDADAFANMSNLTVLSLQRNLLDADTLKAALAHSVGLQRLDLSDMYLPEVREAMLGHLPHLTHLDVSDSSIEHIDPELWPRMPALEVLQLDHNELTDLGNVSMLSQLRKLHVSDNQLTKLDVRELTNLDLLDASYNALQELPAGWMVGTDVLFMLNLSHNALEVIDHHAFQAVTLHTLDLSHNRLKRLQTLGQIKLSKLHLHNNRLTSIAPDAFRHLDLTLEDLDLSHNNLTALPAARHDFVSLQSLNLAHNNLGAVSASAQPLFTSLGHLQVLNLAFNQIVSLPDLRPLHHLTTLYLHGNHLVSLPQLPLASLAKLVVADNRLAVVEPRALSSLEFLEVIDLSHNPFDCTCQARDLLRWINSTLVTVLYIDVPQRYQCATPEPLCGTYLLRYEPEPHCEKVNRLLDGDLRHTLTMVGLAMAALLVFAVLVSVLLYYGQLCQKIKSLQYRWQIRYREVSGVEIAGDPKV